MFRPISRKLKRKLLELQVGGEIKPLQCKGTIINLSAKSADRY